MIGISSDKSFQSLSDELIADIDDHVIQAAIQMVELMIDQSPVDTARFVSNWYADLDYKGSESNPNNKSGGQSALSDIVSVLNNYSITENEFIYIYNNVFSEVDNEYYASTVSWDSDEKTAMDLLDNGLNRFAGVFG